MITYRFKNNILKNEKNLFYLLFAFNSLIYAQDTLEFTDLYSDYLGQTPPGDTPMVFAGGIVSTDLFTK
jgi:hypothetical protein